MGVCKLRADTDFADEREAWAMFGTDGVGIERCDSLRLFAFSLLGSRHASLEPWCRSSHDDPTLLHPCPRGLGYNFRTVETSLVIASSDAGSDIPDRHDSPVQAICRNGLDRRCRDLDLEPPYHPHLDGHWQELLRTLTLLRHPALDDVLDEVLVYRLNRRKGLDSKPPLWVSYHQAIDGLGRITQEGDPKPWQPLLVKTCC